MGLFDKFNAFSVEGRMHTVGEQVGARHLRSRQKGSAPRAGLVLCLPRAALAPRYAARSSTPD